MRKGEISRHFLLAWIVAIDIKTPGFINVERKWIEMVHLGTKMANRANWFMLVYMILKLMMIELKYHFISFFLPQFIPFESSPFTYHIFTEKRQFHYVINLKQKNRIESNRFTRIKFQSKYKKKDEKRKIIYLKYGIIFCLLIPPFHSFFSFSICRYIFCANLCICTSYFSKPFLIVSQICVQIWFLV